jgi:hypothetical protein
MVPPYQTILEDEPLKRIEMIEEKPKEALRGLSEAPWIASEKLSLIDKIDAYRAMIIAGKAVITWARRYSRLAKIMAEGFETDPKRKEELLQISDICWRVPVEPAKGFWDSMQVKWFTCVIAQSLEHYSSDYSHKEDRLQWTYYRGKLDCHKLRQKPVKEIFQFPLAKNFRIILTDGIIK